MWNTRISKALTYALVLPLLSVMAAVSTSEVAHAATVGTGICAQTVGSATGVTVTQVGNDCLVQFTDTTASNTWTVPANIVNNTARILVVGGGGGGGGDYTGDPNSFAGGGGGGGVYDASGFPLTPSASVSITVGAGGAGGQSGSSRSGIGGRTGSTTSFGSLTAGGGGGGTYDTSYNYMNGLSGTAGGGGGGASNYLNAYTAGTGGSGTTLTVGSTSFTGRTGGNGAVYVAGVSATGDAAPGGGAGGSATRTAVGAGIASSITGTSVAYGIGGGAKGVTGWTFNASPTIPGVGGDGWGGTGTAGAGGVSGVVIIRYTPLVVNFDANSGSGSPSPSSSYAVAWGSSITLPSQGTLSRSGYTFAGWNTASDASGTTYAAGASYTPASSLTMYAIWRSLISYDSNTATSPRAIESTTANTSAPATTLSSGTLIKGIPINSGLVFNMNAADSSSIVGSTWYDYSRNGTTANIVGSPTYNAKEGYFQLDGSSTYIDLGTSAITGVNTTAFSASVMFKSDRPNLGDQTIMGRYENTPGGTWIIRTYSGGNINVWRASADVYTPTASYNEGSINYATITYDGTTLRVYLNGVLQTSSVQGSAGAAVANLMLGVRGYNGTIDTGNYWSGRIYSAQGYSRALTATEVAQNYQAMMPGQITSKTNFTLAGYNTKADGTGTSYGTASTDLAALPTPYLRMQASGYNSVSKTWTPTTGSTSVTIGGSPTYNASGGGGNGAAATFPTVSGATTDTIKFGNPVLKTYTFCYVARYRPGTTGRIIQGDANNWVSGFYYDGLGDYYHEGWGYYPSPQVPKDNSWHYSCESANRAWWDGTKVPSWTYQANTTLPSLDINTGTNPGEASTFEFADLIIYNQYLSDTQVAQVNRYIKNTYGIYGSPPAASSAVVMSPPTNYASSGDTTLYAQWGSAITYDGNLQSSGTAPSPSLITNSSNTLASNSGSLTRAGFRFDGWNAAADGSGTNYPAGGVYPNTGNATLYAQWTRVGAFPLIAANIDPNYLSPYMRFKASDYDPVAKIWKDSSGNGRNVPSSSITGNPQLVTVQANTNGSTKSFQVVQGNGFTATGNFGTADKIAFGNPQLANYTLFNLARYNGTNKYRILASTDGNQLFGFFADNSGNAATAGASYHSGWLTPYSPSYPTTAANLTNWYLNTDSYNLYRVNGSGARQTGSGGDQFLQPLGINTTGWNSDFQVAEVIIYDKVLTTSQIQQVEDYLASTYGLSAYTAATTIPTSLTYNIGTTVGGRTDTLTAINGLGTKSFSITPQVSGITLDTSTTNGVAVVVSSLVPTNTYNETLTATDQAGATSTFNLVLNVAPPVKFDTSTPTALATTYGKSASLQIKAIGGLGGKLFSIYTNPLSQFSLDTSTASSGYATLSTTGFIKPGTYSVVIAVTDSTSVVSKYTVAVTVNAGPVITYANGTVPTFRTTNLVLNYDITNSLSYSGVETRVADLVASNYASFNGTIPYSSAYGGNLNITGGSYLDGSACISSIATSSMSYFMWINPRANGVLLDEKASGWFTSTMDIYNGAVRFRIYQGTTLSYALPSLNQWYYVGMTYDGSKERAYVNGVQVLNATVARSVATGSTNCLSIGQPTGGSANLGVTTGGEFLFGAFHVYSAVLTDTDVASNYEATQGSYLVSTTKSGSYSIATTQGFATSYSLFSATQGTGNKTFALTPTTSGISLDTSTTNAAILNISTGAQATNSTTAALYNETMTATDSVTGVTKYNIAITINPPVTITPTTATTLSTTYGFAAYDTFTAAYGTGTYTFSNTTPTYASAFTLTNPSATTSVLKIANNLPVGTYYDTFTVTDSVGATTNYPLTVIVNAALSLAGSPSNSIITTKGKSASLRINVSNGTGTKTLTMASPATGISLDTSTLGSGYATLNVGTSTPANTYSATINAVDSTSSRASVTVSITVNMLPAIQTASNVTSGLNVLLDGSVYSGSGPWQDQSGNGFNATLGSGANPVGTDPTYTTNSAGTFSLNETTGATTNYAQIAFPGSLETFTVSAWVNFSSIPAATDTGKACIICQAYVAGGSYNFAVGFDGNGLGGNVLVGRYFSGNQAQTASSPFTPSINTWYYISYTVYKNTLGVYYEDLYVNGVRQGSTTATGVSGGNKAPTGASGQPINIGKRWDSAQYINGQIGGVSIYGRALSDTEVVQNYTATSYRFLTSNSSASSIVTTQGVSSAVGPANLYFGTQPYTTTLAPTVSGVSINTSVPGAYTLNLSGLTSIDSVTARTILETVTVTDAMNASTNVAYTITVNPAVQETYTAASLTTTSGITTYDTFTATYGTGNKTFALTGSPSTNGFVLTTNGNQAVLSTTSAVNPGTYYETITATDSVGATKSLMVTITVIPGPTLIGKNVLTAAQGFAFTSPAFSVINGVAPYTYSLASQAISPSSNSTAGITFDSPTMTLRASTSVPVGTYSETITVTDSKGASSNYVISFTESAPLAISGTITLTKRYGELAQQGFTITGGLGNYSYVASTPTKSNICAPVVGTTSTYTWEEIVSTGACNWISPPSTSSIDVLVAGGGGGGGGPTRSGGGGGGGVASTTGLSISSTNYYPVNVGAGGGGGNGLSAGYNGGDSWISATDGVTKLVAAGGGGGGASWGNNGAAGNNAPTATIASAPGNGGGAAVNFYDGNFHDYAGGSAGTGGTVIGYKGGDSYKCSTVSAKEDGQTSSSAGRVTGGGGGAGGVGGGQTGGNCGTFGTTPPNGGAAVSTTLTGSTLYFGGGGGGSDGRANATSEYAYGSNGRGAGSNGAGNGEQLDVYANGANASGGYLIRAAAGSNAADNSGGGGGGGITTYYAGGSGAVLLRYTTPTTRVTNAMTVNTVSTANGSGSVLLTVPELVTAGTTTETISVTSAGSTTNYAITIIILKETSTVSLSLPASATTAKYGNAITLSAALNNDGAVTFYDSGTAISGCSSVASSSQTATCTWTPTNTGTRQITASIVPTDSTDFTTATSSVFNVLVNKADTLTVSARPETFTYNGSAVAVTKPFTYSGLVSIDTLTAVNMIYSGTANDSTSYNSSTAPIKAGSYTITADTTTSGVAAIYSHYASVTLVTSTLTINRTTPSLALAYANSDAVTYSPTATLDTVTATRSGTGTKSFASITPITCSVDSTTARISVVQAGYCQITMSVAQDPNYLTANLTDTVTISKATRTISLSAPVTTLKYYDTTTVTATISAGATDGAVTYSLNATPGCSLDTLGGILQATSGTLACTLNATVAEGTNYLTATTSSPLNLTIAKANAPVITIATISAMDYVPSTRARITPSPSVSGLKGSDNWSSMTFTYGFVSNPFETFSYSDTNTPIDAGTYSVTPSALQLSSGLLSNYQTPNYASSAVNFTINRIAQAAVYVDNVNGDVVTPFTLTLRGGTNPTGTATFTYSGAGCTVTGTILTATTAGQCLVRGTLSANRNYLPVVSDTTTVRIRSYTLIPVFTFAGSSGTGITLAGATPLTKGSSSCASACVPTISLATPNQGNPGDIIVLTGTGFTGVTKVIFNVFTNALTFNADSDTQITVQIPAGVVTNYNDSIDVVTPGGTSARFFDFTILP